MEVSVARISLSLSLSSFPSLSLILPRSAAVLHTYTHDRLWPAMSDMAQCIGSQCNIVSSVSGGNPFDEAFSDPWAQLMDAFPHLSSLSMGCQSATIELRGEDDVCDSLALQDARGLYCLLARRGYVLDADFVHRFVAPSPGCLEATPLTAVDNMEVRRAIIIILCFIYPPSLLCAPSC